MGKGNGKAEREMGRRKGEWEGGKGNGKAEMGKGNGGRLGQGSHGLSTIDYRLTTLRRKSEDLQALQNIVFPISHFPFPTFLSKP